MDDADAIVTVCFFGAGAAVYAIVLYLCTAKKEPTGFRLVPRTVGGWIEFFMRTLILICILSMACGIHQHIHPGVRGAWAISAFLLLIIALGHWKSEGVLYRIGFVLGALGFLAALLFPEISTT